jgi:hypothetical protein
MKVFLNMKNLFLYSFRKSIAHIEDLSNELFYEIFEYLDGYEIYKSFSKLNNRFQDLLLSSSLPLKIDFYFKSLLEMKQCWEQFIIPNKHKIVSFYLKNHSVTNHFLSQYTIDVLFNHLKSIVIYGINENQLISLISMLTHLSSLAIDLEDNPVDPGNLYSLIFRLPLLKYIKLSFKEYDGFILLPFATSDQFSTIEYLVIDHPFQIDQLVNILSYTPQLCRLSCKNSRLESNGNYQNLVSIRLPKLTQISLRECDISFDEFEIFIAKISPQLHMLRIIIPDGDGESFLDTDRWEQFILKHIPQMNKFYFEYHGFFQPFLLTIHFF